MMHAFLNVTLQYIQYYSLYYILVRDGYCKITQIRSKINTNDSAYNTLCVFIKIGVLFKVLYKDERVYIFSNVNNEPYQ